MSKHQFETHSQMKNFLENRLEVLGKQRKIIMDNFLISSNNFNREIELLSVDVRSPMELNQSPAKDSFQAHIECSVKYSSDWRSEPTNEH